MSAPALLSSSSASSSSSSSSLRVRILSCLRVNSEVAREGRQAMQEWFDRQLNQWKAQIVGLEEKLLNADITNPLIPSWQAEVTRVKAVVETNKEHHQSWASSLAPEINIDPDAPANAALIASLSDFRLATERGPRIARLIDFLLAGTFSISYTQKEKIRTKLRGLIVENEAILSQLTGDIKDVMDANAMITAATRSLACHLIPPIMQKFNVPLTIAPHDLLRFLLQMKRHPVDFNPLLTLLSPCGLDPVYRSPSALSIARDEMATLKKNQISQKDMSTKYPGFPQPSSASAASSSSSSSSSASSSSTFIAPSSLANVTMPGFLMSLNFDASLVQSVWFESDAESANTSVARRIAFMQVLIEQWKQHSQRLHKLLLDAAPNHLIPPLVDITVGYLDLDLTPSESA